MIPIPIELNNLMDRGANMAGFVPLLYSIARDYRNGQRGIKTMVEIGVRGGISTNSFLYGLRDRSNKHSHMRLYSIDINDCSGVVKDNTLKKYWEFILGDSKKVIKTWDKGDIDVLLIDGDHSFEGVRDDFRFWEPYVKEGGIILLHDVLWPHKGVIKFFWDGIWYPKVALPLSKSGLGIVYKLAGEPPYYDEAKIRFGHDGIKQGK